MKKFMLIVFGFLVCLAVLFYALLFTQAGNDILKPTLQSKLSEATQKDVSIEKFSLRSDTIDLGFKVDKHSFALLSGSFNLFQKSFDLVFKTSLKDIKFEDIYIGSAMVLEGKATGDMSLFNLVAKGTALNGKINIELQGTKDSLTNSKISLKHIEIKEILALLAKPAYAEGFFDFKMDIKSATKTSVDGKSDFKLFNTSFNESLITQDLKVDIPKDSHLKANISTLMHGKNLSSKIDIVSSFATLNTIDTNYELDTKTLTSDYTLKGVNFAKFEPVVKTKLNGVASFSGDIKYAPKEYKATLNSDIFGGKTAIEVLNDTLKIDISSLKLDKIMTFINKPIYTRGDLSLKGQFYSLRSLKGTINQTIENATVDTRLVNKDFNQTLPQVLTYSMTSDTIIANDNTKTTANILSSIANLSFENCNFGLKDYVLDTQYKVTIDDLSAFKTIAKMDLRGDATVTGKVKKVQEALYIDGRSLLFDGKIDFKLENDIFSAIMKDAQLSQILYTLVYPDFFTSTLFANINYDLKNSQGTIKATSNDGRFKQNQLGTFLLASTGFDITQEIYKDIISEANITKDEINFKSNMTSKNTNIKVEEGNINQSTEKLLGKIIVKIKEKEYFATLGGKTSSPSVKLDSNSALKQEIKGKIQKKLPSKTKNLLKGFGL